jgi:hypothetical protein
MLCQSNNLEYAGDFLEGDSTGDESRAAMTFHPLATQAILELAYFPINQTRVGSLKHSLARWLTTRMSHNYRQARKHGFVDNTGYWYRSHLLCIARNAYVLSGHGRTCHQASDQRVRVDGSSSEGSTSNTLDLTPPEVDVTKATIPASLAKMLTYLGPVWLTLYK